MTIIPRPLVRAAVERALKLDPSLEIAIAAVAASLALPVECVREVLDDSERITA